MSNMKQIDFNELTEEITILKSCTQTHGTDILNFFEIMDQQLALAIEIAEELPENNKSAMLKNFYIMDTILRQIRSKVDTKLFWAIDNVVFEAHKEKSKE